MPTHTYACPPHQRDGGRSALEPHRAPTSLGLRETPRQEPAALTQATATRQPRRSLPWPRQAPPAQGPYRHASHRTDTSAPSTASPGAVPAALTELSSSAHRNRAVLVCSFPPLNPCPAGAKANQTDAVRSTNYLGNRCSPVSLQRARQKGKSF